ncbi:hypothetical protein BrevBR_15455 [Brevundimonas sp. BR2-1]|uniref:hypothetical protein n=1 Tax=Brevundimonas sp. BR2-1 TaxID=3031123 RepID=UPI0030AAB0D8
MPLDDLSHDLTPAKADPAPPSLEVMTRVLRLPTRSPRQARSIVRMQLDRLSPLPAADTAFDLVCLRQEAAETVYALGIIRRSALNDPAFSSQRRVAARQDVEGATVLFRFRNAGAVDDREARWLAHAPRLALVCLGLAAVALAGNLRAEQWRERRLPEIATAKRLAAQQARTAEQQASARADWAALQRADAATRYLCVAGRLGAAAPGGVAIARADADAGQVSILLTQPADTALHRSGGELQAGADPSQPGVIVFPTGVCS